MPIPLLAAIPALLSSLGGIMGGTTAATTAGTVGTAAASEAVPAATSGGLMSSMGGAGTTGARPGGGITPYEGAIGSESGSGPPQIPTAPGGGDASGFANSGMTPPSLPNPREEYGGLMRLSQLMDPNRAGKEDPFQTLPAGGLMGYLQALSRS